MMFINANVSRRSFLKIASISAVSAFTLGVVGCSSGEGEASEQNDAANGATSVAAGYAYAVVLDNSANSEKDSTPMVFFRHETLLDPENLEGFTEYDGLPVKKLYSDFEYKSDYSTSPIAWSVDGTSSEVTSVSIKDPLQPNGLAGWFSGMEKCSNIEGLSNVDLSVVRSMKGLFQRCYNLVTADGIEGWNTRNVIDMDAVFSNCPNLEVDCSGWDTLSVETHESFSYNAAGVVEPEWPNGV